MPRIRLLQGQRIRVSESRVLFEIEIDSIPRGRHKVCIYIPQRYPDGSYAGADTVRAIEINAHTSLEIPFDGTELGLPSGKIELFVVSDDAEAMTIELVLPENWQAEAAEIQS